MSLGEFQVDKYTIGCWLLNGNANDETGNHNGTVNGATSVNGRFGGGYDFDGEGDNISISDNAAFEGLSAITFEAWIYIEGLPPSGSFEYIIAKYFPTTSREWYLGVGYNGVLRMTVQPVANENNAAYFLSTSEGVLSTNTWNYVAGIWIASTAMSLFVDGRQVATTATAAASYQNTSAFVVIGAGYDGYSAYFEGVIDSARISNVARSAEEIRRYYAQAKGFIRGI